MEWKQKLEYYDITTILFSWSTSKSNSLYGYHRKLWRALDIFFLVQFYSKGSKHQNVQTAIYVLLIPQDQFLKICITYVVDNYFLRIFMLNFLQTYAINIKHGFINSITEIIFHDRYFIPVHQIFPFTTFNSYHKMRGRGEILHIVTFASNNISDNLIVTLAFRNNTHIRISDNFHITSALKRNQPFRNSFH